MENETTISVQGAWRVKLDPQDLGEQERWLHSRIVGETLYLPGTLARAGIGTPISQDRSLTRENVRSLRSTYRYIGAAWYQREITVPKEWSSRRIELYLERVMVSSRLWVDGIYCGEADSLSTPHAFNLSDLIRPGQSQTLTLRIDNRDKHKLHTIASGYTEDTQSIWNGVIGVMELRAVPEPSLRVSGIYAPAGDSIAAVDVLLKNDSGEPLPVLVSVEIRDRMTSSGAAPAQLKLWFSLEPGATRKRFRVAAPFNFVEWNEFTPRLYDAQVALHRDDGPLSLLNVDHRPFGCREIRRRGRSIILGDRPIFLRGTLDCCVFPHSGHPPMDKTSWERYFRQLREFGLNHVRFHSWCPPEAAFAAADELGVYLQIEPPVWLDDHNRLLGSYPEHYTFIPREAERIIEAYGHHPSFILFSLGNELTGDFDLLSKTTRQLREMDPSRLYTLTSNWDRPVDKEDEFYVAQSTDGVGLRGQYFPDLMARGTELAYDEAVALRELPTISHEIGQYAVYPDIKEISEYQGPLTPVNFEAIRLDLRKRGMLHEANRFVVVSGRFAAQLYKTEIEAALATEGMAGFQLLGLQDYPGQSTATIGLINSLGSTKDFVSPSWFRRFCGPRTILFITERRVLTEGEELCGHLRLANHASHFKGEKLKWKLTNPATGHSRAGTITVGATEPGLLSVPVELSIPLGVEWNAPARIICSVELADGSARNEWNFWLFPKPGDGTRRAGDPRIVTRLDAETRGRLEAGERLLFVPDEPPRRNGVEMNFYPVFWSPVHFETRAPCGLMCEVHHPALLGFPTEEHSDFQWYELTRQRSAVVFDTVAPWVTPIVTAVPNFFHNRRLGVIFELPVLSGTLIVSTLPLLSKAQESPAAAALLGSLLSYLDRTVREGRPPSEHPVRAPLSWEAVEQLFT